MADLDNQTEEALGWAAEGKNLAVDIPEVSFKDAGTFVASMTPIIGDAMAAKEVYDELQKDEPNYYLAGALGGAALVGLVPGLGDVAAKAIKKGAREVFDVAKRVEVDPNAMGSGLGNVRLKPKDLSDIDKPEEFSGTLKLKHGYRGDEPKEFVPQGQYTGDRYDSDGGVFGSKPLYMEDPDNPAFLGDSQTIPFKYDDIVEVNSNFDKAFVLTPDTVGKFNTVLKDIDTLDDSVGPQIVDRLEKLGYDGLIIKGFPDPVNSSLGKLRDKQYKALEKVGKDFKKGRSIVEEYAPKIERLRREEGIDEIFQQPQVLALRPEKQKTIKNGMGSGLGNVRLAPKQPKKTVKAYKLFTKGEDGKLYPLFVDADTEVPTGTWLDATFPDYRFTAENGKQYVPSRGTAGKKGTGDSIKIPDQETRERLIEAGFLPKGSKAKSVKAVAARPGWHAGDVPIATHIGPETKINGKSVKYRGEDQVWAEVEMPADVDWQTIANSKARIKKDGTPDVRTADINDEMPSMGHYRYKTNPNMTGEWLIGGEMKVNRVLSREEVNAINEAAGVKDLPTLDELNKGYSKGGVVMDDYQYAEMMQGEDDQTVRAFAIGGLAEDVDPVSGNEVPTGSLPEEVRDDIPAQLSEGEYVVPADVVRFFGVKFFEDIRNEAKRGFADMEANGRIGGEPIGMEMAEDELPFDISELQIVDDETEEQPMMNMGGYMRGYADGGLTLPSAVTDMTESTGIPTPVANLSGIEMKEYVGPNGEIMYIQFINGVAQSVIPEGYTAKAAAPTAPAVPEGLGVVTAPDDNNNTAHEDMMREAQERESIDWTSPDVGIEQYEKTMEQSNSMLAKGFSGLATVLGGPIVAGFMAVAKRHQNKKMLEGATARLEDPNVKGAEREKWTSIHNRLSGLDEDGKARNSFTEGLANLLTLDDGMEYVNGVLVDTKTGKVLKPGIANSKGNDVVAPTPTPKQSDGGGNDNDSHTSMIKAAQAAAKASKTTANLAKVKEKSKAAYKAATSTKKELESQYGSGLNKGGLMKKK